MTIFCVNFTAWQYNSFDNYEPEIRCGQNESGMQNFRPDDSRQVYILLISSDYGVHQVGVTVCGVQRVRV